ncbi:MAG: hypothetical protein GF401_13965 [Chitinivibrionales bacterium]|nr:hypothetical protein [Chitinivibrionales bacterium]
MKSTSKLVEGYKSIVDNSRNHGLVIDLPPAKNGTDLGPTALELCVMGLSGCITTIFSVVATNSKLEFDGITAVIDADQPQGAPTITKAVADVTVISSEPEEKVKRIFDKTLNACPVEKLFEQAGISLEHNLVVKSS